MRRTVLGLIGSTAFLTVSVAAQKPIVYTGEIMDSLCAQSASHDKMMASNQMKTAEKCTFACVKNGATFVLFDPDTKTVFELG
jgi:hypothetical protein